MKRRRNGNAKSVLDMASLPTQAQLAAVDRKVQKALRQIAANQSQREKKRRDEFNSGSPIIDTGTVWQLNNIAQGDDRGQRDGNQVFNLSMRMAGRVDANTSAAAPQYMRFIIFRANNERGVTPTMTSFFGSATPDVQAFKDWDERYATKVLYDRLFICHQPGEGNVSQALQFNKKFTLRFKSTYIDTGTTCSDGGIYAIAFSDQTVNGPSIKFTTRMLYYDA